MHSPFRDLCHRLCLAGFLGQQIYYLVLDQRGVDVEYYESLGSALKALGLHGDVESECLGGHQQRFTETIEVGARDDELVTHDRIVGEPDDPIDVASGGRDCGSCSGQGLGREIRSEERHRVPGAGRRIRLVLHHLELDIDAALPTEEQEVLQRLMFRGDPDEQIECEAPLDHDLFHVVYLRPAEREQVEQPGCDAGGIAPVDTDQNRVVCHPVRGYPPCIPFLRGRFSPVAKNSGERPIRVGIAAPAWQCGDMQGQSPRPLFVRIALFVIGGVVLIIGVLGWFLPLLPGWLLVVAGLAILAREFPWARRLLDRARSQLNRVTRRSPREGD